MGLLSMGLQLEHLDGLTIGLFFAGLLLGLIFFRFFVLTFSSKNLSENWKLMGVFKNV